MVHFIYCIRYLVSYSECSFRKVFLKLNLDLTPEAIRAIAKCVPYVMENFLMVLREKLDIYLIHSRVSKTEKKSLFQCLFMVFEEHLKIWLHL